MVQQRPQSKVATESKSNHFSTKVMRHPLTHTMEPLDQELLGALSGRHHNSTARSDTKPKHKDIIKSRHNKSWKSALLLIMGLIQLESTRAQIGVTECACSPSVYRWTINYGLTCANTNIALGPGIEDIQCLISTDVTDDPNQIIGTSLQVVELDQNNLLLNTAQLQGPIPNGQVVEYVSKLDFASSQIPRTIEVGIVAEGPTQTEIRMQWTIAYSNACDVYPVLTDNDQIAWTIMVSTIS